MSLYCICMDLCPARNLLPPHYIYSIYCIMIHRKCEKRGLGAQIFGAFKQIDVKVVIQDRVIQCKGT